ncbi:MAG: hypothetical protein WAX14_14365 [Rhodococcus sp. (in: high G+C Gram-positive bacteria)]
MTDGCLSRAALLAVHGPGYDQARFLTQFATDHLPRLRELG